jgi:hypothetical protein
MAVSAGALASIAVGSVFVYAGIKGKSVPSAVQSVLLGHSPSTAANANSVSTATGNSPAGDTSAHSNSAAGNQAIARFMVTYRNPSWATGQQWADWVSLWNQESGWSNTVANQSSGALGIAQALGHGTSDTAGSLGNEYGGYGLSAAQAKSANSGSAADQILWGIDYIEQTYGSPSQAWAHEESAGWY